MIKVTQFVLTNPVVDVVPTEAQAGSTEIDEKYWRKYPDLKPGGSMTRELSEAEAANLNQELSEAVASFKILSQQPQSSSSASSWNIHDLCGEMHAE